LAYQQEIIAKEENDAIQKLTKELLRSRHTLKYVAGVFFLLNFVIVGLLFAVVYSNNYQRSMSSSTSNVLMTKDRLTPQTHDIQVVSSEMSNLDMSEINFVNFVLGTDTNSSSCKLKTTGLVPLSQRLHLNPCPSHLHQ
jgi:hypothetical protein